MLLSLVYNALLSVGALLYLPRFLYDRFVVGKYRESFSARWGCGVKALPRDGRFTIWVHAVSVGETKAVVKLLRELKGQMGEPRIVVSTVTETGMSEAKRSIPFADRWIYLPFDFSWVIGPVVRKIAPDLLILSETDFWYNFISAAKRGGAAVALVNGKLSARAAKRYSFLRYFSKKLFSLFDLFLLQSEHHRRRFEEAGARSDKLLVTGNIKLDDEKAPLPPSELAAWKEELGIEKGERVVVLGSTHHPEEALFLDLFLTKWSPYSDMKLFIVPRHPERFDEVAAMIEQRAIPYARLSLLKERRGDERVILVDAMGLLSKCYEIADLAIVCGSFTSRVGGHNIVEPCHYGVPVLYGPHMESQPELVRLVEKFGAALPVTRESVAEEVVSLLYNDRERAKKLGEAGRKLTAASKGATMKSCKQLAALVGRGSNARS